MTTRIAFSSLFSCRHFGAPIVHGVGRSNGRLPK